MDNRRLKTLLLGEAAVCAAAVLALHLLEGAAFPLTGLPLAPLGTGLSTLAGTGRIGFALAMTLYAALVLLPLYALAQIHAHRALRIEDALLAFTAVSVALALLPRGYRSFWEATVSQTLLQRMTWQYLALALVLSWCVLRLLRRFQEGESETLLRIFRALLGAAAALFVFSACFVELASLLAGIETLRVGNTALTGGGVLSELVGGGTGAYSLPFSVFILCLRALVAMLPPFFAAATALLARELLDTMEHGAFTERSAACAPRLAAWCAKALRWSVLTTLAVNVLQAVCAGLTLSISITLDLPVMELCFVLAALLGAKLITANVALKSESDLFI